MTLATPTLLMATFNKSKAFGLDLPMAPAFIFRLSHCWHPGTTLRVYLEAMNRMLLIRTSIRSRRWQPVTSAAVNCPNSHLTEAEKPNVTHETGQRDLGRDCNGLEDGQDYMSAVRV